MHFLPKKFSPKRPLRHRITSVAVDSIWIRVQFEDGRTVELPCSLYPRLLNATEEERNRWRLIGSGAGIHWPNLDEDISAENILERKPSLEGDGSFRRWLAQRAVPKRTA